MASKEARHFVQSEDHELTQYVNAFTVSSDRVRAIMLISIVATILVFAAFRNSMDEAWKEIRVNRARIAVRNTIWNDPARRLALCRKRGPAAAGFQDACSDVAATLGILQSGHGEVSLKDHLNKLEEFRVNDMLTVRIPFLGIHFDINDLGSFSAIGMAILSLTLCFATARQHENLYLCLWKVRRLAESEIDSEDQRQSKANFLYHALAMAQVFTRPPTLARWRPRQIGLLGISLIVLAPLIIQSVVLGHDLWTFGEGTSLSPSATRTSMAIQVPFFISLLFCSLATCAYMRADDRRWSETFFAINQELREVEQPSWWEWLHLSPSPAWSLGTDAHGQLWAGEVWKPFASYVKPNRQRHLWHVAKKQLTLLTTAAEPDGLGQATRGTSGWEYGFERDGHGNIGIVGRSPEGTRVSIPSRAVGPLVQGGDGAVYMVDGVHVLRIPPTAEKPETFAGDWQGNTSRSLFPKLLGLASDPDQLLIADYDFACVRAVSYDGRRDEILWRSRGSWAPAGVGRFDDGELVVLEHRRQTWIGAILGLLHSARVISVKGNTFRKIGALRIGRRSRHTLDLVDMDSPSGG